MMQFTDDFIRERLAQQINRDIALVYHSFLKLAELGQPVPDYISKQWITEVLRACDEAGFMQNKPNKALTDRLVRISIEIMGQYWLQLSSMEQFELLKRSRELYRSRP